MSYCILCNKLYVDVMCISCSNLFECFACQLRVRAQDGGSPRLSSTTLLTITVQRNLAAPVFTQNSYTTTIPETQAPGSNILTLQATDSDLTVCMLPLHHHHPRDPGPRVQHPHPAGYRLRSHGMYVTPTPPPPGSNILTLQATDSDLTVCILR